MKCALCNRRFRSESARRQAEAYMAVHTDFAADQNKQWPITKHDRSEANVHFWKRHGEKQSA